MKFNEVLEKIGIDKLDQLSMVSYSINYKDLIISFVLPENIYFKCANCQNCCRSDVPVPISIEEANEISINTNSKTIRKGKRVERQVSLSGYWLETIPCEETNIGGVMIKEKCMFCNDNNCGIYQIRPIACQKYPFLIDKEDGNKFCLSQLYNPESKSHVKVYYLFEGTWGNYVCNGFHHGEINQNKLKETAQVIRKYLFRNYDQQVSLVLKNDIDELKEISKEFKIRETRKELESKKMRKKIESEGKF